MNYQLLNLMATRSGGLQAVVDAIEDYLKAARVRYNSEMGPRALGRLETELLPDARRQLSSYRARFGALIEFLLGMIIDTMLKDDYQERLRLSFVVTHQYPDFYLRDVEGKVQLRCNYGSNVRPCTSRAKSILLVSERPFRIFRLTTSLCTSRGTGDRRRSEVGRFFFRRCCKYCVSPPWR